MAPSTLLSARPSFTNSCHSGAGERALNGRASAGIDLDDPDGSLEPLSDGPLPGPLVETRVSKQSEHRRKDAHPSVHFNDDARPPRDPRVALLEPAQMSILLSEVPISPSRSGFETDCRPSRPRTQGKSRFRLPGRPPRAFARQRAVPVGDLLAVISVEPLLSARITPRAITNSPIPFDVFVHSCFIAVNPRSYLFPAPPAPVFHQGSNGWTARTRHLSCR